MQKLSKDEMKKVMGGLVAPPPGVYCTSAGARCGPDGATCMDPNTDWGGTGGSEQDCCCSDDTYNNECDG